MADYKNDLVGRVAEIARLREIFNRPTSSFLAVYGRRRVGKTYLIRTVFKSNLNFHLTGIADASLNTQLQNFAIAFENGFNESVRPQSWLEAFTLLSRKLDDLPVKKKVVFIDELPWFDTPRSGFLQALDHFWNSWASARDNVLLIVCGSAASWMIAKLINARGGFHNRVTDRVRLLPFNLAECEDFFKVKRAAFNRAQIVQLYMVLGGIPFYLEQIDTRQSAAQNINRLCFNPEGLLRNEFSNLYKSLFKQAENHIQVIESLGRRNKGMTRRDLLQETRFTSGGTLSSVLSELEESHFIRRYQAFGKSERGAIYQLCDPYSFFYFKWIKGKNTSDSNFWLNQLDTPQYLAWSGYAFEQLCLEHTAQIKTALGISGVSAYTSAWQSRVDSNGGGDSGGRGAQIDLLIDRRDQVINVCEIKFSAADFSIDKKYAAELERKIQVFKEATKTKKSVYLTLITTLGLKQNTYSYLVQNTVTLKDLFVKL